MRYILLTGNKIRRQRHVICDCGQHGQCGLSVSNDRCQLLVSFVDSCSQHSTLMLRSCAVTDTLIIRVKIQRQSLCGSYEISSAAGRKVSAYPSTKHASLISQSVVSTATLGTSLGTGGMETKIIAAELATVAGVTTVIINSLCPQDILPIIEASEDVPDDNDRTEEQIAQDGYGLPKCTRFIRQPTRLNE